MMITTCLILPIPVPAATSEVDGGAAPVVGGGAVADVGDGTVEVVGVVGFGLPEQAATTAAANAAAPMRRRHATGRHPARAGSVKNAAANRRFRYDPASVCREAWSAMMTRRPEAPDGRSSTP